MCVVCVWVDGGMWAWLMCVVVSQAVSQAVSLYWMGAAAEKSGDMQAGECSVVPILSAGESSVPHNVCLVQLCSTTRGRVSWYQTLTSS